MPVHEALQPHAQQYTRIVGRCSQRFPIRLHAQFRPVFAVDCFHEFGHTAGTISLGNQFIRLIDGSELAELMIKHGVGVVTEITYEVKELDANYFADF